VDALDILIYGIEEFFEMVRSGVVLSYRDKFIGINMNEPVYVIILRLIDCVHKVETLAGDNLIEIVNIKLGAGFIAERIRINGW